MALNPIFDEIKQELKLQLPGFEAQSIMSPLNRQPTAYYLKNNPLQSAVLVLIYPKNNELYTLLTIRSDYGGVHSGQISFPGGKHENDDADMRHTALRETQEEIGVNSSDIEVIGELTDLYIPASNFIVNPVVGISYKQPIFNPDPIEVKTLLEIPLLEVLNDQNVKQKSIFLSIINKEKEIPCFDFNGNIVWGATALILSELKELIKRVNI